MTLLRLALSSLMERKVRSLLTMLGIIIGVASVFAMLAIGNGAKAQILEGFDGLGTRTVSLSPIWQGQRRSQSRPYRRFNEADLRELAALPNVEAISGRVQREEVAVVPGADWATDIVGTDENYLFTEEMEIRHGRNLDPSDHEFGRTVAVIGSAAAKRLFGESFPVGQTVSIKKVPFEIVGLIEEKDAGISWGGDPNDIILVPRSTARNRLFGNDWLVRNQIDSIRMVATSRGAVNQMQSNIDAVLRRSRGLSPADAPDFRAFNSAQAQEQRASAGRVFTILLASMGAISLLVGGVGVMNIMLVSVTERTREIGLRMSVGARRGDILKQFLVEAIVLCGLGGLVGLVLGFGASKLAENASVQNGEALLKTVTDAPTALLAFGSAVLIGVLFGFLPARRASRLNPVEALRHE
jgi:putative ABC transport system permease protein